MKAITKNTAYARLTDIKEKYNINVSPYIHKVAESNDVPYDVLIFINKYESIPQLEVYNHIYNNRKKNPLYKNLVNENLPIEEKAIALSSLLTQTLITTKFSVRENKHDEVKEYSELMNLDKVTESLMEYVNGNPKLLEETFTEIREIFKQLYKG
jgi:hypothetical protein